MAGHVRYTAVIDACVFYGMLKTDALMSLCARGLFAAKWSERIAVSYTHLDVYKRQPIENAGVYSGGVTDVPSHQ